MCKETYQLSKMMSTLASSTQTQTQKIKKMKNFQFSSQFILKRSRHARRVVNLIQFLISTSGHTIQNVKRWRKVFDIKKLLLVGWRLSRGSWRKITSTRINDSFKGKKRVVIVSKKFNCYCEASRATRLWMF
jgi:hypothetical protein